MFNKVSLAKQQADVAEVVSRRIEASSTAGWHASLSLTLARRGARTVLAASKHRGPLRVQRPFYPEGSCCHLYLLHPPGGMVAGDNLSIEVDVEPGAELLLTTPAAGKFYRVLEQVPDQYQGIIARVEPGASLEWLPQETIVFNGARGELLNRFDVAADASLLGWDIICLGRRASGELYEQGSMRQRIEIFREGVPLYIDRVSFDGGSEMLNASWGMQQFSVTGTFFVVLPATAKSSALKQIEPDIKALREALPDQQSFALTQRGDVLLARYLGHSAEACRRGFEALWRQLRPQLLGREASRPRIWNT